MYMKLFGLIFLPSDIKKIIYFDVDIIVNEDISLLYSLEPSTFISGVSDIVVGDKQISYLNTCFNFNISNYINAGIILYNLERYDIKSLHQKEIVDFLLKYINKLPLFDQDFINLFFMDHINLIPEKWNTLIRN